MCSVAQIVDDLRAIGCAPCAFGRGWIARCPAHRDSLPTLSVVPGDGGRVIVRCHAGCSARAVLDALGQAEPRAKGVA